jgi:hypothetical protein
VYNELEEIGTSTSNKLIYSRLGGEFKKLKIEKAFYLSLFSRLPMRRRVFGGPKNKKKSL